MGLQKTKRKKQLTLLRWIVLVLTGLIVLLLSGCAGQDFTSALATLIPTSPPPAMPPPVVATATSTIEPGSDPAGQEEAQRELPPGRDDGLPRWEPADCRFSISLEETVECGYVVVPEDRDLINSGEPAATVRLHTAIVRSRSLTPASDPVIYLSGGPGQQTLTFFNSIVPRFEGVLEERDFIIFDQRGVGHSEPSLYCQEVSDRVLNTTDQHLSREETIQGHIEANLACRERLLAEGINIAAYTSAENAADVNDLRLALGYGQINLYGVSYGTRLALTVMRDFGAEGGIRSVVLDSVFPPQVDFYAELAVDAERIFKLLFERCAADPACQAAYPDLETVFYDLVRQWEAEPVLVEVPSPGREEPYQKLLNGDGLIDLMFNMLYDTNVIPVLPQLIFQLAQEDYDSPTLQAWLRWLIISDQFRSLGMWYSVMCGEEAIFSTEAGVRERSAESQLALRTYFVDVVVLSDFMVCDGWEAKNAGPIETAPIASEIPSLILAGEFDPITPPAWSQLAAETLSPAYYFEFPGVAHGVLLARQCARDITAVFIERPTLEPEATCMAELPPLDFITTE